MYVGLVVEGQLVVARQTFSSTGCMGGGMCHNIRL
jgi:hypothetical protein